MSRMGLANSSLLEKEEPTTNSYILQFMAKVVRQVNKNGNCQASRRSAVTSQSYVGKQQSHVKLIPSACGQFIPTHTQKENSLAKQVQGNMAYDHGYFQSHSQLLQMDHKECAIVIDKQAPLILLEGTQMLLHMCIVAMHEQKIII